MQPVLLNTARVTIVEIAFCQSFRRSSAGCNLIGHLHRPVRSQAISRTQGLRPLMKGLGPFIKFFGCCASGKYVNNVAVAFDPPPIFHLCGFLDFTDPITKKGLVAKTILHSLSSSSFWFSSIRVLGALALEFTGTLLLPLWCDRTHGMGKNLSVFRISSTPPVISSRVPGLSCKVRLSST